ncbi:MAG: serine/threonine protein kinase [Myxococcaceae bacterium]|nr:serine/threonine protein kinase [Myxococcaceae bacterium]
MSDPASASGREAATQEVPPGRWTPTPKEDPIAEGSRIGPYRLLSKLGEGGMSVVYLASRDEAPESRPVALKFVLRGPVERFHIERRILGALDHPNIARLHEVGSTDEGVPYFVMEYVEGARIDEYCEQAQLSITQRLQLFLKVCAAVQYAHQNLVVHRDIKPGNILVSRDGEPKLLDFGIAKLLAPEGMEGLPDATRTGVRLLTPRYASPEQLRGGPITTATDVYSLGVLLYQLITGELPYDFKSQSIEDVEQALSSAEPRRPSQRVARDRSRSITAPVPTVSLNKGAGAEEPREAGSRRWAWMRPGRLLAWLRARRDFGPDLDNIVLMALRKEAARRYASVEQLSEDLRRYLGGRPVLARDDTLGYRLGKFLQRHRLPVSLAAGTFLLVLGFAVLLALQVERTARERDQARLERDKAEKLVSFMRDIFEASDPAITRGGTLTARQLLERGAARVEKELVDQPELQAGLMITIGNVYVNLGEYEKAQPLLDAAGELRRRQEGERGSGFAESVYARATLHAAQGHLEEAEAGLRQALAIFREQLGPEHVKVGEALSRLATVRATRGDMAGAEALAKEALGLQRRILGEEHPEVASVLNTLAGIHSSRAEHGEAERLHREALAIQRKVLGEDHPQTLSTLKDIAATLYAKTEYAAAEPLQREVTELSRKVLGAEHPDYAHALTMLGLILYAEHQYAEAEPYYRQALAIQRKALGAEHPAVAWTTNNLAALLYEKGDAAAAEPLYHEVLASWRKSLGPRHAQVGHGLHGLGRALVALGRFAEAEKVLRENLVIWRESLPAGHWRLAQGDSVLGGCLAKLGRYAEAEPLLAGSFPLLEKSKGLRNPETQLALERLVELYRAWRKPVELARYEALLAQARRAVEPSGP